MAVSRAKAHALPPPQPQEMPVENGKSFSIVEDDRLTEPRETARS